MLMKASEFRASINLITPEVGDNTIYMLSTVPCLWTYMHFWVFNG